MWSVIVFVNVGMFLVQNNFCLLFESLIEDYQIWSGMVIGLVTNGTQPEGIVSYQDSETRNGEFGTVLTGDSMARLLGFRVDGKLRPRVKIDIVSFKRVYLSALLAWMVCNALVLTTITSLVLLQSDDEVAGLYDSLFWTAQGLLLLLVTALGVLTLSVFEDKVIRL